MPLTLRDMKPIGLCTTTEELFDTRRFLMNFCDGLLMGDIDSSLKNRINFTKRDMNSFRTQGSFLPGYKTIIANNIDRIMRMVDSRFKKSNPSEVNKLLNDGKQMISLILNAQHFDDVAKLEADFKSKISLPVYHMFLGSMKKETGII